MKRHLIATFLALASAPALAQTPDTSSTPPAPADAPAPTPAAPVAETPPTESGKVTPTTQPAEAPKKEAASSWTDRVKFGAKAYLRYSYELGEEAKNSDQFNIDRLYLQAEFFATDKVRFQITFDAGDTRNGTGNQVFFAETKNAYIEVKDVLGPGLYLRAGVIPLAWIPYEEDLWGYRVQGALPVDRWGYITSADLGLSVGGALPSKYGSFQVNVNNGEGYKAIEVNKRKEVQARLSLNPLASMGGPAAGLFVTGYGSFGEYDDAGLASRVKSRVIGEAGLQSTPLTLAVAYMSARDSNAKVKGRFSVGPEDIVTGHGLYAFGVLNVGALAHAVDGVDLFARYDHLDPDREMDHTNVDLLIAGAGYRWNKNIKSLVDYETVTYGADFGGVDAGKPAEKRVKLQTEFKF
ncbi:hypothetical protein [Hyalangium versicolor]|uniref:hypothetical protein n=1 Tax=Hyalangium versicolor TaxID=2861190 RepID=UPI001CC9B721|nr:hypothetical protein [Hyalangium versicolor]